jgi:hypothetical protein
MERYKRATGETRRVGQTHQLPGIKARDHSAPNWPTRDGRPGEENCVTLRHANVAVLLVIAGAAVFYLLRTIFNTPTVEVQAAWTTAGLIGTVVTALNLRDARRDQEALRESGSNADLEIMARESIRIEAIRLSKMIAVVAVGIVVLTSAPTLTAAQRARLHIPEWTTQSIIITAALLWIVFGTVAQSILDRRLRMRFYGHVDK